MYNNNDRPHKKGNSKKTTTSDLLIQIVKMLSDPRIVKLKINPSLKKLWHP